MICPVWLCARPGLGCSAFGRTFGERMHLTVVATEGDLTRLECSGEIIQTALWPNANPLEETLGDQGFSRKVLISLFNVDYIDSAGVGLFIVSHKKFREAGGMLVLHSIPPLVNHIFQLLKMDKVLHLAKDEEAALALVHGTGQK
jgi:anti-anti-sigma factor